ncbi:MULTISPECIES: DUF4249 domain-containing protein [Zobellia]|uniref:DUF4249 domain-containing protein n=1 Tax=Zobellia TaxID=112040 RepID=UPI00188C2C13|nr:MULTISPECIES: DUF4249 domain-containing protein [Zobellia]
MKTIVKTVLHIACLCIGILVLSCETDVTNDIDLVESTPKLVIDGGLERNTTSPLTTQQFRLTTTNDFLSKDPNPIVSNAVVSVTDGTTTWTFEHTGDGLYSNDELVPELGNRYTVNIQWNGETYEGSDMLNETPQFERFFTDFQEETIFSPEGYILKFDTTDPVGIENFYYTRLFRNGEFVIIPDPGNSQVLITSDDFFDGQKRIGIEINGEIALAIGDVVTGQQLAISEGYFNYLYELFTQTGNTSISFGGNPPPATIRSNVINLTTPSNRSVGYFYTVDVTEDTLTVIDEQ